MARSRRYEIAYDLGLSERQIKVKTMKISFSVHSKRFSSLLDLVSESVRMKSNNNWYFCSYSVFSRMKWKKENNFKSLNDPHVKIEASATNQANNQNSYPLPMNDTP